LRSWRVVLVLGAVAALGGAVWLMSFRRDVSRELRAAASAFLTRLSDGRGSEAYAQAADQLKAEHPHVEFLLMVDDMNAALGRFRKMARVATARVEADAEVTRADFVADAEYDKQVVRVAFRLVHREDGWRVAAFEVEYPPGFWPAPDAEALQRESTQLVTWLAAGDVSPLYARFHPEAWSDWKPWQFEADLHKLRSACGTLHADAPRVVATNAAEAKRVEIAVACATGAPYVVRLEWTWLRGKWRLQGMRWAPGAT
jgi:hypothetical protein